jgi:transcriptional regulator with XRE-family HTH domain
MATMHGVITGLRTKRTERFLTQRELAERCDVSVSLIQQLEAGKRSNSEEAQRIAAYLDTDLPTLYSHARTTRPPAEHTPGARPGP